MAKLKLQEAAKEILAKSIENSFKEEPKAIRDPNENDTGEAVVKNTAGAKNYAKNVKKNSDEVTDDADPGDQNAPHLDAKYNITKNSKAPEVDNDGIEEECDDDDDDDEKDDVEVDGDDVKDKKDDDDDDDKEDVTIKVKKEEAEEEYRASLAEFLDSKVELDITEDVEAMFHGADLSEEFKEKVSTIFEAAVRRKVKEVSFDLAEAADRVLDEEVERIDEELSEQVMDFMKVVMLEWLKENQVPIEKNLRTEITEDFIASMKNLFTEHYIDIPDDKVDVVNELSEEVEELKESLNEEITEKIENYKYIKELESEIAFIKIVEDHDLTVSQKEKLRDLAEDLDFDDIEKYTSKVNTLIESYILGGDKPKLLSSKKENTLSEENDGESAEIISIDMNVKAMADALGKRASK